MATLEKIRSKAGLLVLVVGIALFAFIIGDFLNSGSSYFRQNQEQVSVINGEAINYHLYQERIEEMTEIYKMQSQSNSVPEEVNAQIRQSVYDAMVREIVLGEAIAKSGISVTADELFDMVQGDQVAPMVQQFPYFIDQQTGAYSKAQALNFLKTIENMEAIPEADRPAVEQIRRYWLFWERNMKFQRLQDKYNTLLTKAIVANPLEAKNAYAERTPSSDIVYTMQSYATIPDTTITIDNSDIKRLYEQRKSQFKQQEGRVLDYIAVAIKPGKDDYEEVRAQMAKAQEELTTSTNMADVVNAYSEVPYADVFVSSASMDENMKAFVEAAQIGEVSMPTFKNESYSLYKLIDKKMEADSVKVSRIIIPAGSATDEQIASLADSLLNLVKTGTDINTLAATYSAEQPEARAMEWFNETGALRMFGEEVKNELFKLGVNAPSILKTKGATFILNVTQKTAPIQKYKLAYIFQSVTPSSSTQSALYNDLNQFVAKNNSADKIRQAVAEAGYELITDVNVGKGDQTLGTLPETRQIVRWAFENTQKDEVSQIFEARSNFIIAIRKDILKEGFQSLETVAPMLTAELRAKKKGEEMAKQLTDKKLTSIDAYAQAMNATVDTVRFVTMGTPRITGIGMEPVLNARIAYAKPNQVSQPVPGNNGVYVFQVINRAEDTTPYDEKTEIRNLESATAYRVGFMALQSLVDEAEITDNRIRFE